jgi:quinol monooxygenase YgiN
MSSFLAKIPHIMTTGLDLTHYSLAAGFIDLPGDQRECGIMQDVKVLCLSANARQLVLAKAAKLAQAVESEGKDNGVFSFMVLSNLDVDKGVRLFLRFSSRDAMERHMRRKDVLDFWMTSKEDITTMESRGYVPNGKGWLHR